MDDAHILNLAIYYGSFLAFPYLLWLGYRLWKKRQFKSIGGLIFLLGLLFIWSRFIEPQLLFTKTTVIPHTKIQTDIVLISDLHIGIFKGTAFLERVVNKVNSTPAKINIITGDFAYDIDMENLDEIFAPLSKLNRPTYIVLGNHDSETRDTEKLKGALIKHKMIDVEQKIYDLGEYQIAGVGDRWDYNDKINFSDHIKNKPLLVLAHNPDSIVELNHEKIEAVFAGHTHCGQIRIPWLYKKVIPSEFGYDCGLTQVNGSTYGPVPLYITTGLGEIALPMRLFNPPTIDLIQLRP